MTLHGFERGVNAACTTKPIKKSRRVGCHPIRFQRQTMKFWVQLEDVIALKVEILKRLPILLYRDLGKSSPLITSVYLEKRGL